MKISNSNRKVIFLKAWERFKASVAKTVTFVKVKTGEVTTRNIRRYISSKPGGSKSQAKGKQRLTIKVIDTDKEQAGLPIYRCIISFYPQNVISFTY